MVGEVGGLPACGAACLPAWGCLPACLPGAACRPAACLPAACRPPAGRLPAGQKFEGLLHSFCPQKNPVNWNPFELFHSQFNGGNHGRAEESRNS